MPVLSFLGSTRVAWIGIDNRGTEGECHQAGSQGCGQGFVLGFHESFSLMITASFKVASTEKYPVPAH
jgi:hypothetical protein